MKTERVFLMELFLDDELPKNIKLKIKDRFQDLEEPVQSYPPVSNIIKSNPMADMTMAAQSPSMQRLMQQNPDLIPKVAAPVTPAAAAALAQRQALLNNAGKEEKGSKAPRKI